MTIPAFSKILRAALFMTLFTLLGGCASKSPQLASDAGEEQVDQSCSYFYFLWGTQAEIHRSYPEALEAYEKALICDPNSDYIETKIPVLYLKMGKAKHAARWLESKITDSPERYDYQMLLAGIYVRQEEIEKAVELYTQLLGEGLQDENISLRLGLLYTHLGKYEKARQIFNEMIQTNPESYFAHLSLARLLEQTGDRSSASISYEKAFALNWSRELAFELGQHYLSTNKFEESLRVFTTITRNDPLDERAALSQVQALLELQRDAEALEQLDTIATYTKNLERIDIIRSKVLLRQDKREEARNILVSLVNRVRSSQGLYMLALLGFQDKSLETALKYLERLAPDDEEFEEGVYLKTRIYRLQNRTSLSKKLLSELIRDKEHRTPLYFMLLGSLYQYDKDYFTAQEILDKGIALFPDNAQIHFEYGMVLERSGKFQQAVDKMKEVLVLQPDHAEALNYIGYTWADQNSHLDKALEYIKKANTIKPDNAYIIDSLGWVYYRLGKLNKAAAALERSLSLLPADPQIYEHLGDVYNALGKSQKAIDMYQKGYDSFTSEEKKAIIREKIDKITRSQPSS